MTRFSSLKYFSLFLAIFVFSSCSSKDRLREGYKPRYFFDSVTGSDSYEEVFEKMTKVDRAHSEFQPVITAHATFWNATMREAFIREMSGRFRLDAASEKNLASQELQENETYFVFVVSVATREFEWNELERANSMWRMTLESNDGKLQETPQKIEVVSTRDERWPYFYKHMDAFTRTYRVRFLRDRLRTTSPLVLHISGMRGNVSFEFPNPQSTGQTQ